MVRTLLCRSRDVSRLITKRLGHVLMGHANVDTTLNVYTQVLDGSVRDAVEKIGGELFAIVHRHEGVAATTDWQHWCTVRDEFRNWALNAA